MDCSNAISRFLQQHLKRAPHSKRKRKSSLEAIDASMKEKCCKENCISSILTKEDVFKNRKQFRDLSEEGQRSFILNFFLTNQCFLNGRRKYTFRVNCKKVCRAACMANNSVQSAVVIEDTYIVGGYRGGLIFIPKQKWQTKKEKGLRKVIINNCPS